MKIETGKVQTPIRAVAYGPEGWGKSSLAAAWPKPLFVDIENSTQSMDVARTPRPSSWAMLLTMIDELTKGGAMGYQTLVVDTADWAERLAKEAICAKANVRAIGDVDYGKLYQQLATEWAGFLDRLTRMQDTTKMHVCLLAHSCLAHVDIPEESGTVDRHEMKLTHSFKVDLSALTKEWATLVLHLGFETMVLDVDGKKKAQGGTKRIAHTSHHACWDAKQRPGYDLPDTIACPRENPIAELGKLFSPATAEPTDKKPTLDDCPPDLKPATAPTPTPAAAVAPTTPEQKPIADPDKEPLLIQLADLMKASNVTKEQLGKELARKGVVPADMNPREYNVPTLKRVVGNWTAVAHNISIHRAA